MGERGGSGGEVTGEGVRPCIGVADGEERARGVGGAESSGVGELVRVDMDEGEVTGREDGYMVDPVEVGWIEGVIGGGRKVEVVKEGLEVECGDVDIGGGESADGVVEEGSSCSV